MNEEWLHKVHDRMADYETDEPEDLWTAIEERQKELSGTGRKARRPVMLMWAKRGIAAAVMLAAVVSVVIYSPEETGEMRSTPPLSALTKTQTVISREEKRLLAENTVPASVAGNGKEGSIMRTETSIDVMENRLPSNEETGPNGDEDMHDKSGTVSSQEETIRILPDNPATKNIRSDRGRMTTGNGHTASPHSRKSGSGNLSVAVFTSGGTGAMLNRHSAAGMPVSSIGPEHTYWKDAPLLGILLFNQGEQIETDIKHRLPVRAGISFTYRLNDRLGIESGISYTNLTSDIREGSEDHYLTARQRLHYIGIPLNMKYRILSWKRLSLYASAGVLAEKCVSANLDREVVLDRQTTGSETEKLHEKPMQWSANASLGLQCDIIEPVGLFVEPGISYSFKDGTTLQTIYKDKPLNMNLNLGIRLTFGK